jgi:glutamate synthase domain-containing protein 2/glutamate synthase domain-containing protein 1/glutamate synthase domain-containing protein 3
MTNGSFRGHPDHDACGTGLIVHLGQPASHEVVDRGLVALQRLAHRGGVDADGASGDGAGLLTAIPQRFIRRRAEELGISLPHFFGMGMLFLPLDEQEQAKVRNQLERLAAHRGLRCLGWREVPINHSVLGARAAETAPSIWQCFLAGGGDDDGFDSDFEAKLFLFRKRAEAELSNAVYFCSLSSRTVVYKGLLAPWQLPIFYPDLDNQDFESQFALFHQRFSTNTQPSWSLAQPFRFLAHNGEINTIVGNRRWMHAREVEMRREQHAGESGVRLEERGLEENVSDSASLDNALELLVQQGYSPEAGLLTLTPPAFETNSRFDPFVRGFLESAAREYEPWDGPAALVFSDGRMVGAKLDRNGLRPLRYTRTADGWLVVGSEAGIAEFEGKEIIERQRLGPGEMLVADLRTGEILCGDELLNYIAAQPHRTNVSPAVSMPLRTGTPGIGMTEAKKVGAALGWSQDQLRILLQPLAEGKEAIWSMGDDTPPAFMSHLRRTLWDYCKQRFAQVTNPPIDPLRESHVMSLRVHLGREFISESPVLDSQQFEFLRRHMRGHQIDITFAAAIGVPGALQALERIQAEALLNNQEGLPFVLLSDRSVSSERAALPALLAAAAVWKAMVSAGNFRIPLIVETAQALDTHHVALLLAVGAAAVSPSLAMRLAEEHQPPGVTGYGAANYCQAVDTGLKKVLSRMGISTIASYRNGQLFETVGLGRELCDEFFESATHVAGTASLQQILEDYLYNHELAFRSEQAGLRDAGLYRYRKEGEQHETSPELLRKLHGHVKIQTPESYHDFEELGWNREPIAIRDLMELVPQEPVEIGEVEPESEILRRFSTQAMSLGAISPEAHRTLALAMNRLGGRSNTGEGGEDPDLYSREPEAANKVKQIASGRFGVTTEYLVHAEEIEIKIAQGSKPGEGGQLPANKVTPYIARLRHAVPGMSLISPPPHHDIYSIEDLAQLIHDLREVNPEARIGVKLVAGAGVGVIAAGVAKAGADVITVSGHNGGTGASPLSSIKNTGLPWEFGLRDVHRTLINAGLRQRVRLRVDGGLKFARDVVIAALLGADEFGFGTAALLAIGCVMARQCHLNTCPAGIATQDEALRTRFSGSPEMVIAYFQAMASEVRVLLATLLGARNIDEIVGRTERLKPRNRQSSNPQSSDRQSSNPQPLHRESHHQAHDQESCDWMQELLHPVPGSAGGRVLHKKPTGLARQLASLVDRKTDVRKVAFPITNADLSVGAHLSGEVVRKWGVVADESAHLDFEFRGVSGQSFGAFLASGINFRLLGEANDYVGKGLSGGSIVITAGEEASRRGDVLAGNTILYGATSGELYIAGRAGERFAVRNSGALAVVEGLGDHGCEYMTGGVVLVLGSTGLNFGSGMTGGLAYVLTEHLAEDVYNRDFVRLVPCSPEEEAALRQVLRKHFQLTESPRAGWLLNSTSLLPLVRVQPSTLPCSVEQTWAAIRQRYQDDVVLEAAAEVQPI